MAEQQIQSPSFPEEILLPKDTPVEIYKSLGEAAIAAPPPARELPQAE